VANLDESDVGRIRPRQAVTFRVDAYPNDTFRGVVSQVRLEPKVQQNVVTYATVIDVPNDDLRLKPGMTANVNVEIARASNVVRVPNGALRFRPSNDVFAALGQTPPEPQGRGDGPGGRRGAAPDTAALPPAAPAAAPAPGPAAAAATVPAAQARDGRRAAQPPPTAAAAPGTAPVAGIEGRTDSDAERRARLAERMQNLSPEERDARVARMRERRIDPNSAGAGRGGVGGRGVATAAPRVATPQAATGPTTIDALFAPLPRTESVGRAWTYVNAQLQPLRLRLGITDGQFTELIAGDLQEGQEVVTNVTIAGQSTRPATTAFPGFGGAGGRQGFPGGGLPGGGGRTGR